jgi:ComF family protein
MTPIRSNTKAESFTGILMDFVSLFYPRYCFACTRALMKGEDGLCTHCLSQLPKTNHHLHRENPIMNRLTGRLQLEHAFTFLRFRKGGMVQKLLHELKYHNQPALGVKIGMLYGRDLKEAGLEKSFDVIIPVPLHEARKRKRGYNQSAKFAEGLSEALNVPWEESVSVRLQSTHTQTRKNRADRWANVSDAFSISKMEQVNGKRVLLVDDVITTGATLEACGQHLLSSHCSTLSIACIAEA